MKDVIICPECGHDALLDASTYHCSSCGWDSSVDTWDISYSSNSTAPLSNLFPHAFEIDGFKCQSMESFIQSLREENCQLQKSICSDYSGYMAYKLRLCLHDWRKEGFVFWQGKPIPRCSLEYRDLITRAYDALFAQNIIFKEILTNRANAKYLIHSIGCDVPSETLLTELEYRFQLNRLRGKYSK